MNVDAIFFVMTIKRHASMRLILSQKKEKTRLKHGADFVRQEALRDDLNNGWEGE